LQRQGDAAGAEGLPDLAEAAAAEPFREAVARQGLDADAEGRVAGPAQAAAARRGRALGREVCRPRGELQREHVPASRAHPRPPCPGRPPDGARPTGVGSAERFPVKEMPRRPETLTKKMPVPCAARLWRAR